MKSLHEHFGVKSRRPVAQTTFTDFSGQRPEELFANRDFEHFWVTHSARINVPTCLPTGRRTIRAV